MILDIDRLSGRFKSAPWYGGCKNDTIYLVGLGGIGSNFLYTATKTLPCKFILQDMDTVDEENVFTQWFNQGDIGAKKVTACINNVQRSNPSFNPLPATSPYNNSYRPIMVAALDNMATRKQMFDVWKENSNKELFIDARLRAEFYEVFVVTPDRVEDYEKTLFNDNEIESAPCTYKATSYFGMLCGARITHVLTNYFANKYSEDKAYALPFEIREFGNLMYFETKD